MPIYRGVDGVTREAASAEYVREAYYHGTSCLVGLDGVARQTLDWTVELDHFEVVPASLMLSDVDTDGEQRNYVISAAEALKYGSVDITSNSISVRCSTTGKGISISCEIYAVFKDGHRVWGGLMTKIPETVTYNVQYVMSNSNGEGIYNNDFAHSALYSGRYNNYVSGSKAVSVPVSYASASFMAGICTGRGPVITQQIYTNAEINGKSYPIKAINNLDSLS